MGFLDFLGKEEKEKTPAPRADRGRDKGLGSGLFELFGKKKTFGDTIFSLKTEVHPMRLPAHKNEAADLDIEVANAAGVELLTSVVVEVVKPLALDQTGLSQEREIRLGLLAPGERKQLRVAVWSTQRTTPGSYPVKVYAISHYRDYGHVLNEVRQRLELRVV